AIRVANQPRLQHAVVVDVRSETVAEVIAGFHQQQVMWLVEVDQRVRPEWVAIPAREEEVSARFLQLRRWKSGRLDGKKRPAGRNPPSPVAIQIDVATSIRAGAAEHLRWIEQQHFVCLPGARALEDLGE